MKFIKYSLLISCIFFNATAFAASQIAIITHPDNAQNALSAKGLKAIFSMRLQTWKNKTPIKVFVLKDNHDLHTQFSKEYIGVFPHQLRKAWDRLVFSGTGQAPIEVNSEEEMLTQVKNTPGAIGYLTTDKVDDSVKTIQLN